MSNEPNNYKPRHAKGGQNSDREVQNLIPKPESETFFEQEQLPSPSRFKRASSIGFPMPQARASKLSIALSVIFALALSGLTASVLLNLSWVASFDLLFYGATLIFRTDAVTTFFSLYTELGEEFVIAGLCLLVVIVLLVKRNWKKLIFFASIMISGEIVCYALKLLVDRARPQDFALIDLPTSASYPSGHSFSSFLFFVLVAAMLYVYAKNRRSKATGVFFVIIAILLSLLMAFSRVYLGVHWASDVLASWLLALLLIVPTMSWYSQKFSDY